METTTIRNIKTGYTSNSRLRIYIIEGEGCILYVGKSKCAITRMESHLGIGEWAAFFGSSLDQMLISNPKADDYVVTFLNEDDILNTNLDLAIDDLEERLIYEFSPVFNSQGRQKHRENSDKWYSMHPPPVCILE